MLKTFQYTQIKLMHRLNIVNVRPTWKWTSPGVISVGVCTFQTAFRRLHFLSNLFHHLCLDSLESCKGLVMVFYGSLEVLQLVTYTHAFKCCYLVDYDLVLYFDVKLFVLQTLFFLVVNVLVDRRPMNHDWWGVRNDSNQCVTWE